ncbi:DinB family protein [Christiangramia forsetii]|uniref:DinB family protein n=2 Tax=Christiangramia forsetii TaxID=411153 RepID=A0M3Y7_CHRFK|nr:DinB family protein [Christiangramia forsetii]GGG24654.1 diguanylate cyclase [Christiangramia forsetii]CAL67332.1 DinB family protein [Christiangramia forsetii KT0803]
MKDYFKELLEYSHYYNLEIIKKFNDGDLEFMIPERAIKLLSHILNAQNIWNNRVMEKEDKVNVWQNYEVDKMKSIEIKNFKETLDILENEDLDRIVKYKNSKGERYQNSLRDIIFHVVNHSTYHRGQIATEFRKEGIDPIVSDFVYYKLDN